MPILTDSIIDIGTYTTFNIGLSKAISNYTVDEIWDFPYCSSQWIYYKHIGHFDDKPHKDFAPGGSNDTEKLFPLKYTGRNDRYYPQTYWFDPGEIEYNNPDGIYCRVLWLYGNDEQISNLLTGKRRSIYATDGFKIITQMDCTKVVLYLDNFRNEPWSNNATPNNINTLNYDNIKIKEEHEQQTSYTHPRGGSIFPVVMFKYNNKLYLHMLFQRFYESLDWAWGLTGTQTTNPTNTQGWEWDAQPTSFDGTEGCYFPVNIGRDFGGLRPQNVESFHTPTDIEDIGAMYQWYYGQTGGRINPVTENAYLTLASYYGGMFYHNGTYYKPIIQDGYVEGYTNDMNAPSDIDNWIGATNHSVPLNPPHGGGGDDEEIDMPLSQHAATSGFVHYYSMTYANIVKTAAALNSFDISLIGKDLLRNIISYKLFAISPANLINSSTNVIVHIAGHELKDDQDNYITGDVIESLKNISLGSIKINEHFGDFRDYAPFTKLEIYVPFCGWATLPPWCMGKTLSGEMFIDLPNGTVKAVIKSSKTVVAELGGCCSVDIPFVAESTGAKTAAVISKIANTAAAVASGSIPAIGTSSIAMIGAINANYTDMQGVCGDGSNLNGLDYVYIKISRPSDEFRSIPAKYKHQHGLPCNKAIKLAAGDGYTQIMDADIEGSMTDREKQMIIDGFRHGLIL